MAEHLSAVSLYRICIVYVSNSIHFLCPVPKDISGSAFPLNLSKHLVVESLKDENFTFVVPLYQPLIQPQWASLYRASATHGHSITASQTFARSPMPRRMAKYILWNHRDSHNAPFPQIREEKHH
ncbi:hypothetical protein MRX96_015941 [Rhipicephalus microplus]